MAKSYTQAELDKFAGRIEVAANRWRENCERYVADNGDVGSCVLGAGIYINLIPKGCRKGRPHEIISAGAVSPCQGSVTWEHSQERIVQGLREQSIDCWFEWGNMD